MPFSRLYLPVGRRCGRSALCLRPFACRKGEMTEWLKVRAWKVRIPQKGIVGSNPAFSAIFCR